LQEKNYLTFFQNKCYFQHHCFRNLFTDLFSLFYRQYQHHKKKQAAGRNRRITKKWEGILQLLTSIVLFNIQMISGQTKAERTFLPLSPLLFKKNSEGQRTVMDIS